MAEKLAVPSTMEHQLQVQTKKLEEMAAAMKKMSTQIRELTRALARNGTQVSTEPKKAKRVKRAPNKRDLFLDNPHATWKDVPYVTPEVAALVQTRSLQEVCENDLDMMRSSLIDAGVDVRLTGRFVSTLERWRDKHTTKTHHMPSPPSSDNEGDMEARPHVQHL
eukprot:m.124089 g.124089  ORF g.124089 m.124089 type:complete len:165 (-) comp13766_c6_seq12:1342-1836(-)